MPDPTRQAIGRIGGYVSWSQTADRTARTANGRANAPGSVEYWLKKLDPEKFADATDEQKLAAAEAALRAHFQRMAYASAKARRRGGDRDATT